MTRVRSFVVAVTAAAILTAAAISVAAWAVSTEAGTAWVVAQLQARSPVPVSIGEVRGTFWHGLSATSISIEIGADRYEIVDVQASLVLSELLAGGLTFDRLAATEFRYERGEATAAGLRARVSLPLGIVVLQGSLERVLVLTREGETVLGPLAFAVEAEGDEVVLTDVVASGLAATVRGGGRLIFGAALGIEADVDWTVVRDELNFAGRGTLSGAWPTVQVDQTLSEPVVASVEGTVVWGDSPAAALEVQWTNLALPGLPEARSPAGAVRLDGWFDEFDFDGTGTLIAEDLVSEVAAVGSSGEDALTFTSLRLSGEYGAVEASGRVELDPLAWQLTVDGRNLNPGVRFSGWPGALAVRGQFAGRIAPVLEMALSDFSTTGTLRDQPVTASGGIFYGAPNRWELDALQVDVTGNRIQAGGTIGTTLALDLAIDAPSLDRIWPEAAGAAQLEARLGGTLEQPEITGFAQGTDLHYGEYAAGALSITGDIVADESRPVALSLTAEDVVWRQLEASEVTGTVMGTAAAHVAEFDVSAENGAASLRAAGAWSEQRWSGEVAALRIDEPSLGRWSLDAPVALAFGQGGLELGRACLQQGPARLCGESRIGTGADLTDVELTAFDLNALNAIVPDDLTLAGVYDARLSLSGAWPRPAGTLTARGTNSAITIHEIDAPPLALPIETLDIDASLSAGGSLRVEGGLQGVGGAQITLDADVTDLWSGAPVVAAEISGIWSDVGLVSVLSPEIGDVTGSVNVDVVLAGNLRSPDIRGQARWSDGQIEVPRWGFLLEDVDVGVSSPNGTQLLIEASGRAGDGNVSVSGVTSVDPAAGWPTELRIFGERLQAVRLAEADIVISPSLIVRAALPDIEVEGAFLIPYARLLLDELPPQAVRPSPDVVIHGIERPVQRRPLNVRSDVRIGLGDDVRYAGAGLDVGLTGAMRLVYESGQNAVASGVLNLNGVYQAYGQTLEVDRGQLLFTGPLGNPSLDVRAIRRIDTTTAGIQLTGTVNTPVSRVFSEPAMSEADALSYLLLGRPVSGSGTEETASLEAAAFAMGLQQALPAIQRVGTSIGLDELTVQPTSADAGELMAGKRISPRLYVRYSYGLFNRIGGLLMRFNMTDRVSLETRSGDYRSMDLIYTVESD